MYLTDWKMTFDGHKDLPCKAPCSMYSVLYEQGIIEDPFYGMNEREYMHLSEKDCKFECEFEVDEKLLTKEFCELTFLGLDTICRISLNGTLLDKVENMHRAYTYDVKPLLKTGMNKIELDFASPVKYFEKMNNKHFLWTNGDTIPGAAHLRKALYMSGWDWGPTLPDMITCTFVSIIMTAKLCLKLRLKRYMVKALNFMLKLMVRQFFLKMAKAL